MTEAICELCGHPMPKGEEMFKFHGYSGKCHAEPIPFEPIFEFKKCLSTMSHSRAGWDYQLAPAQRAEENRQEASALAKARKIWAENPDRHDDLRETFKATQPLATMAEIEATV